MDNWQLFFTKQAKKDAQKLVHAGLAKQADKLLTILNQIRINLILPMKNSVAI